MFYSLYLLDYCKKNLPEVYEAWEMKQREDDKI